MTNKLQQLINFIEASEAKFKVNGLNIISSSDFVKDCKDELEKIIAENKILKAAILQITYKCKTDNIIENKYIEGTDLSQFEGVVLAYKDN